MVSDPRIIGTIETCLQRLRQRRFDEARQAVQSLLDSCAPEARAPVEACKAVVAWRAHIATGAPMTDMLADAIAGTLHLQRHAPNLNLGWILGTIGYAMGMAGDFETGLAWLEHGVADARQRDDRPQWAMALSHQASLLAFAEELERAGELLEEAVALCDDGEAAGLRAGMISNLAYCQILHARRYAPDDPQRGLLLRQALAYADEALSDRDSPQRRLWHGSALDNRALALSMLGRLSEAEETFEEGLRQPGLASRVRTQLMAGHAEVLMASGKWTQARERLRCIDDDKPSDLVDQTWDRVIALRIEVARHFGRNDEVQALWEQRFRRMSDRYRDRLRNVQRFAELRAELQQAQAAARESRLIERSRLLRDLHDGFGSQLAIAQLALRRGALSQGELQTLLDDCLADLRLVVDTIDNADSHLGQALRSLRNRLQARLVGHPVQLHWRIEVDDITSLGPTRTLQTLRIVQEALANALRHAKARNVWIDATAAPEGGFSIRVRDDGTGVPTPVVAGQGMRSMRARAAALGAALHWHGGDGGTVVDLQWPAPA